MDENPESHMETDVSSTTDDVPEAQEVTGSHGDVEMVIVVEKIDEGSSIDRTPQGSAISSASTSCPTTPEKHPLSLPQKIHKMSSINEINVTKTVLMLPSKYESQNSQITSNKDSVTSPSKTTLTIKQLPESSNTPTKLSSEQSVEKLVDKSPNKITQIPKVIQKSPFKDGNLVSSPPIKLIRIHNKPADNVEKKDASSPVKITPEKSDSEVKQQPNINKEQLHEKSPNKTMKSQENCKQLTPQKNSPEKVHLQEKSKEDVEVQKKSPAKENSVILASTTEITSAEDSATKSMSKNKSSLPVRLEDSTTSTQSKDSAPQISSSDNNTPKACQSSLSTSTTDGESVKPVNGDDQSDSASLPADEGIHTDQSNALQSTEVTEKEHNKSISRELKSLINSARESKIISECTQLTSKTRKSRQLDTSSTSLNVSFDADKISGNRRGSANSQISNCSEQSERSSLKRSMRSQNPEFVNKCKQFLNSVTSKVKDVDDLMSGDESISSSKDKPQTVSGIAASPNPKKKKVLEGPVVTDKKLRSDLYCWRCHWTVEVEDNNKCHPPLRCTVCPRSYHYKCVSGNERKLSQEMKWVCPDCIQILHAEGSHTRSPAMKKTSLGMLCDLLKYALERMMDLNGVEPFMSPVDRTSFPDYDKYVVHPMDLTQMKQNIADGLYGSTEAFIADAQWILHNSIIFNTLQSKLTGGARAVVRSCRAEMGEIEACPECYAAAHARKPTWFTDVCSTPHILLWAKLKGFPYWPAKGMTVNSSGLVDVRFFGAHDRAWVPAKDCFLFSEKDPNNFRHKRQDILDSMQEAEQHIRNISRKYGKFVYPPFKTQFEPSKHTEQLKMMIPSFEGEIKTVLKDKAAGSSPLINSKEKRRSASKGPKSSTNEESDSEDTSSSARTQSLKHDKDSANEKTGKPDSSVFKESPVFENIPVTRKRRRSHLEEAVMTVIETSVPEKKKRIDTMESKKKTDPTEQKKKPDGTEPRNKSYSTEEMKKTDAEKKQEQQEPSSSKEIKARLIAEVTEAKNKTDTVKRKSKDEEPSSSTMEDKESLRVTPIKLVALPRQDKLTPKLFAATKAPSKTSSPKEEQKMPHRRKSTRSDKSDKSKEEKTKRRNSRTSKSDKSLNTSGTPKATKANDKRPDNETLGKELRLREKKVKELEDANKLAASNSLLKPIQKEKDRTFDDDTTLAVIARERRHPNLPTISNVCSLSTNAQQSSTTNVTTDSTPRSVEITIDTSSSIFTPTSTDNVHNMKEVVTKLQKLRDNTEPVVGRVGVRAFARMTSPERNENVEVEIKAEPIDLDEADEDRHNEKMDLMNACKLQPVNPPQNLRDVRISRVILPTYTVKSGGQVEIRPKAKKSFPQPRRVEEGRSELNGKNSMVYIPIQPPATQAPVRPVRPVLPAIRPAMPHVSGNNTVNTVTTPLKPGTVTVTSSTVSMATTGLMPTVGQVPTTVHTVPLMTSVNGQWMFSLQPVMSVGGVDTATSPIINGITDRGTPTLVPLSSTASSNTVVSSPVTPSQPIRTNETPAELPRLQQRPLLHNPLDPSNTAGSPAPPPVPSTAGSLTAKLNQNAVKLADFFRTLLEDSIEKVDDPWATSASLRMQLETAKWRHQRELDEMKHNYELTLAEMRLSFEKDKLRLTNETKRASLVELETAVKAAKSKQWCANCNQEAQFYCCWNTAYCDYPCQRVHWPQHYSQCAQRPKDAKEDAGGTESRLVPPPDNLPVLQKSVTKQAMTVGGKLASARVFTTPDAAAQKASIIVSMVEDNTGNQTMKCVGTYKSSQTQGQIPPLIINKQVMTEETAKKVVTSGGYLIVGSAGNATSVITPAPSRHPHTIQYFS